MADETPWIKHDGGPYPTHLLRRGVIYRTAYDVTGGGATFGPLTPDHPGWLWRWRRVRIGWFRREWRRVCDNPAFAPIIAFRPIRPRGAELLRKIAENPEAYILSPDECPTGPIVAPEHERNDT